MIARDQWWWHHVSTIVEDFYLQDWSEINRHTAGIWFLSPTIPKMLRALLYTHTIKILLNICWLANHSNIKLLWSLKIRRFRTKSFRSNRMALLHSVRNYWAVRLRMQQSAIWVVLLRLRLNLLRTFNSQKSCLRDLCWNQFASRGSGLGYEILSIG